MSLADAFALRATARLALDGALADPTAETARDRRTRRVNEYSTTLAALWRRVVAGTISRTDYETRLDAALALAFGTDAVGVPAVAALRARARDQALRFYDDHAGEGLGTRTALQTIALAGITDALITAWSTAAAGLVWAAHLVRDAFGKDRVTWHTTGGTSGDGHNCEDCKALHGKSWGADEDHPWPGEDGTECGGNCRCDCD